MLSIDSTALRSRISEPACVALIVGGDQDIGANATSRGAFKELIVVGFDDVTAELLDQLRPSIVVSPLLSRRFDCLDLAQRLSALGFSGRLQVLTGDVPRPDIVLNELREHFPSLTVQLGDALRLVN